MRLINAAGAADAYAESVNRLTSELYVCVTQAQRKQRKRQKDVHRDPSGISDEGLTFYFLSLNVQITC